MKTPAIATSPKASGVRKRAKTRKATVPASWLSRRDAPVQVAPDAAVAPSPGIPSWASWFFGVAWVS